MKDRRVSNIVIQLASPPFHCFNTCSTEEEVNRQETERNCVVRRGERGRWQQHSLTDQVKELNAVEINRQDQCLCVCVSVRETNISWFHLNMCSSVYLPITASAPAGDDVRAERLTRCDTIKQVCRSSVNIKILYMHTLSKCVNISCVCVTSKHVLPQTTDTCLTVQTAGTSHCFSNQIFKTKCPHCYLQLIRLDLCVQTSPSEFFLIFFFVNRKKKLPVTS